jgi:thiamine pyrophosphokinase
MNPAIVQSSEPVTLIGGGEVRRRDLALALRRAPVVVGVDGGADRAFALGAEPALALGDFDSISQPARDRLGPQRLHHIAEQETTDFDKALRSVAAPFVLALGFTGARIDHELAVLNALVRHRGPACILIGARDLVFAAPPRLRLRLRPGARLSLFPLAAVQGESHGLEWPIGGIGFAPDRRIGTSNRVAGSGEVSLSFDAPGMLVLLERQHLDAALSALVPAASPRARGRRSARGG